MKTRTPKIRAFCTLEGGGARGVAHVGVLEALESDDAVDIVGYAGASAGSIVATLAAAGFSAREILDRTNRTTRLLGYLKSRKCSHPSQIFGRSRYLVFLLNGRKRRSVLFLLLITFAFFITIAVAALTTSAFSAIGVDIVHARPYVFFGAFLGLGLYLVLNFRGVVSLDEFAENFNEIIKNKLIEDGCEVKHDNWVTFNDLFRATGVPLRIVASNITSGELDLFSASQTGDKAVAQAVAASIALPIVFKPYKIGTEDYADGGLVSNLPAWTFEDEATRGPRIFTITSELSNAPRQSVNLFIRLLSTAVFGSSHLNTRGLKNHLKIDVNTSGFGLLDFNMSAKSACELASRGFQSACVALREEANQLALVKKVRKRAKEIVSENSQRAETDLDVRVAFLRGVRLPRGPITALKPWKCAGFEEDVEEGVVFPFVSSDFKEAVDNDTSMFERLDTRDRRKRLWRFFGAPEDDMWLVHAYRNDRTGIFCFPSRTGTETLTDVVLIDTNANFRDRASLERCCNAIEEEFSDWRI